MDFLSMINMALLFSDNPFQEVALPVIDLVNKAAGPVLGVVGALGVIYCILLGVKLAKAEEQQDREKAKGALKNAIIGFLLIFVLIVALMKGLPAMINWMNGAASTDIQITTDEND